MYFYFLIIVCFCVVLLILYTRKKTPIKRFIKVGINFSFPVVFIDFKVFFS